MSTAMTMECFLHICSASVHGSAASTRVRTLYNLIQYIPLFLLVLFYLVIRSYSGLIGQAQNLLLMYVFFVPLGNYIRNRTGSRTYSALVTGFAFQAYMITSAALISLF